MSITDSSLLADKLLLFESHLQYAWVKYVPDGQVQILEKSGSLPLFAVSQTYALGEIIHKMDIKPVTEHYLQEGPGITKIQFTVLNPAEDENLKIICSTKRSGNDTLSLWVMLPDESRSLGLLAIAAHDMRSPISSIMGLMNLIQMMMMDGDIPADELKNLLEMIKTSGNKALQLTDEILELAEMESEGYVLSTKPVVMKDFLAEYIRQNGAIAMKKRLKVVLEAHTDAMCDINESKVTRVLDNLLSNAAKFSYPDSQIEIVVEEHGDYVWVLVRDHGVGMPEELIDEIFVKFGKAQRQGLEGEDSHGLGMSIVKEIMTLHGGNITVESKERVGTTMKLQFRKRS